MTDPLGDIDVLFQELEDSIDEELASLPCPSVWALRMIFENDKGERLARIYPMVFPSSEKASELSSQMEDANNASTNSVIFDTYRLYGRWEFPIGEIWNAVYHTVVELAVTPDATNERL